MTPRLSGGYDSTGSGIARGLKLSEAIIRICLEKDSIKRN